MLRRHLRLRSFGVLGFGVLLGLGLGAILSTLVVDVVRITAGGELPEPPLLLSFDWPLLLGGVGLFVLVAGVMAMAVTWQALRGTRPVPSAR
jgi:ABC-type antimicrobial peptide transport system permease subunit